MPGECGVIKYNYYSLGRLGTFTKMIAVSTNTKEANLGLYVCGNVYGKGEAKPESYNCNCIHSINKNEKSANIQFEEKDYCFGIVEESEKAYSHDFKFTNTGNEPLILSNVSTTCGCDIASWPKEVFMPGESGIINYKYLSKGRQGAFLKSMTITCNAKESTFVVYVCGFVYGKDVAKPETYNCMCNLSINQNEKIAYIQFEDKEYSFGNIEERKEYYTHDFKFTNTGNKPLVISNAKAVCGCANATWPKEPIMPGQTGIIHYSYSSIGRIGSFTKTVTVESNAKNSIIVLTACGTVYNAEKGIPIK